MDPTLVELFGPNVTSLSFFLSLSMLLSLLGFGVSSSPLGRASWGAARTPGVPRVSMNGENQPLVTNEPDEIPYYKKVTKRFRRIYEINLKLIIIIIIKPKDHNMQCHQLDLKTLRF